MKHLEQPIAGGHTDPIEQINGFENTTVHGKAAVIMKPCVSASIEHDHVLDGSACHYPDHADVTSQTHEHHHHSMPAGAEHATVFSCSRSIVFSDPTPASTLVERAKALFLSLSKRCAIADMVPGHIKGILTNPAGGVYALSATRPGYVDTAVHGCWEQEALLTSLQVTIDILLLTPVSIDAETIFESFTK